MYIAVMGLVAVAAFAEPQVRAYVERTTVSVGNPFLLFIEVNGNRIGDPQIPDVDGLNINKRADRTSASTQIGIGRQTSIVRTQQLGYYAQATRVGKITIPPITVPVDGQVLQTQPILLTVVDRAQPVPATPEPPQPAQAPMPPTPTARRSDEPTWDDVMYVESNVSKHEVYQGEAVQLTLSLWRILISGLRVTPYQNLQFPTTEGFYAATLQPTRSQRQRNGWPYEVTEYRQILYPTTTGQLTIGSWNWRGGAEYGFFQQRPLNFTTPPVVIDVKPLPDRPANFSGAVGSFTIKAQLAHTQVAQGVPTQLTVTISGQGNPDAINAPQLPKIEDVYVSDPEKQVNPTESGGAISFQKTFTYAITPHEPGQLRIPEITFCYFDPLAQQYKVETTAPIPLTVVASTEAPARPVIVATEIPMDQGKVDVLGEDILPIITSAVTLHPSDPSPVAPWVLFAGPVLAYGGMALYMHRKRRFEQDTGYARNYAARSKGRKRLKSVATAAEPSEELYKAVVGFIADKFDIPEAGMTSGDVRQVFASHDVAPQLVERFNKILRACERARYAAVRLSSDEVMALTDASSVAMDRLEQSLKRERRK